MESGVLDGGQPRRPAWGRIVLGKRLLHPTVGARVRLGELVEREGLADPAAQLGERILAEVEPLWPSAGCCTPGSQ